MISVKFREFSLGTYFEPNTYIYSMYVIELICLHTGEHPWMIELLARPYLNHTLCSNFLIDLV